MFVIGERINGMFTAIGDAILNKDPKPVQEMAEKQIAACANSLDINVGTRVPKAERPAVMKWLVDTTREVTDICLAIDTPSLDVMRVGLEAACRKGPCMINSTTGQADKLGAFMKLAKEFNAKIIGLAIDENGVASTIEAKVEIGMRVLTAAMEVDISPDDVYLDPITLPLNCTQDAPAIMLEAVRQFKMLSDPAPHVVIGLSNLSQGATERGLINRTFLAMAVQAGLDASIHDPMDVELMDTMITAEVLMNKMIYSNSYLKAYRQK